MNKTSGIIGFILVFIVGNAVLVGAQSLWHSGDQAKIDSIKQTLATNKASIDDLESRINAKKAEMDGYSANNDNEDYNLDVDPYNAMVDEYKTDIDDYNTLVKQGNDLANKIGGTWYIVPFPSHE